MAATPTVNEASLAQRVKSDPRAVRQGERIVVGHHVSGRTLGGVERDNTVADVFTLENGLVTHMQAYADPEEGISA